MKRRDPAGGPAEGDPRPPTWLTEPCPPWCARDHREQDHPEDRYHQSAASIAPVIASTLPTVPLTASLEPIDLVVRIGRYVGDLAEWVAIEPLELVQPRLVLTVESTRQLVRHIDEQLARHDAC
jgi:hypothetical protein